MWVALQVPPTQERVVTLGSPQRHAATQGSFGAGLTGHTAAVTASGGVSQPVLICEDVVSRWHALHCADRCSHVRRAPFCDVDPS